MAYPALLEYLISFVVEHLFQEDTILIVTHHSWNLFRKGFY